MERSNPAGWRIPAGKIDYSATGEWQFPTCTLFVKNFDLPTDARNPGAKRRLETRLLVRDRRGGVYGVSYQWQPDGLDADLLTEAKTEQIPITAADGSVHEQTWYYPRPQECLTCHTATAGFVLGVKARQLNRDIKYPSGVTDNQLRGNVASFDARYETPLPQQLLIDGPVLIDEGIDKPRVIAPHDVWRSIAYMRVNTNTELVATRWTVQCQARPTRVTKSRSK